jgi:hypothetical protein
MKTINAKTVQKVVRHYFSADARIGDDCFPYFITGDFNADHIDGVAVLFYPPKEYKKSKQIQSSWPWEFDGTPNPSNGNRKSLAIINGHPEGWMSSNTKVFALFDKSGTLETPSF